MPIDFRAPQPFAPGISQAAGAAQAEQANTGLMAQLYEQAGLNRAAAARHAADAYNHAAGQEADRFAQNARTGAALGEQAQESADRLQFQKDALAASRQPSARDVFAAQVGEAQALQHAQLQTWAKQQDFTFADNQAYQRQLAHLNDLNQAHDDKVLTDQEWGEQVLQLKTGIDLAKGRQQDAQAKMYTAHAQTYLQQAELEKRAELQQIALEKKLMDSGEGFLIMPGRGAVEERVVIKNPKTGEWYNPLQQRGKGQGGENVGAGGLSSEQYLKHYDRALEQVDTLIERNDRLREVGPDGKPKGGGDPNITWANRQSLLAERLNGMGLAPTLQEHLRRADGKPGSNAPSAAAAQAPPDLKPFDEDAQASPVQRSQIETWKEQVGKVRDLPIPEPAKRDYAAAVRTLDGLLREYGTVADPSKMSDADRAAWTLAVAKKAEVERMQFRPPEPQSPYGGPVGGWRDRIKFKPFRD